MEPLFVAPAFHFPYPWDHSRSAPEVRSAENGPPPRPDEALAPELNPNAIYANGVRGRRPKGCPSIFCADLELALRLKRCFALKSGSARNPSARCCSAAAPGPR